MFNFLGKKKNKNVQKYFNADEIEKLIDQPYGVSGNIQLEKHKFEFHDARCFYDSYKEIIQDEIYAFKTDSKNPLIIDLLFFKSISLCKDHCL